jgi:hypothetical protein
MSIASTPVVNQLDGLDAELDTILTSFDTSYAWNYGSVKDGLRDLYEKAKRDQWNGTKQLAWDTDVDPERGIIPEMVNPLIGYGPYDRLNAKEKDRLRHGQVALQLSQFLHGEQGALVCTARIVGTVPWIDAKFYAATQVMDEARHVEVFAKYLDTKLSGHYDINPHLRALLDDIVRDSRWDMTYLGMQIMVEGLALAAYGYMHDLSTEPLLKQLLRSVMSDEARHVAFGVLSLQDHYRELTQAELRERQEFAFDAALRMRDRLLQQEVWERLGVDPVVAGERIEHSAERRLFQQMLFSKIVPNCKKLGLLDAGDGWLRHRFEELGVIAFEFDGDAVEIYDDFALVRSVD